MEKRLTTKSDMIGFADQLLTSLPELPENFSVKLGLTVEEFEAFTKELCIGPNEITLLEYHPLPGIRFQIQKALR